MKRHDGSVVSAIDRIERVDDLHTAKEWAKLYIRENDRLRRKLAEAIEKLAKVSSPDAARALQIELAALQEQLGQLQQQAFGESSERRTKPHAKPPKQPQTGHGPRAQDKLPREQKLLEIPLERQICPACNGPLKEMKGQTETTEQITMRARSRHASGRSARARRGPPSTRPARRARAGVIGFCAPRQRPAGEERDGALQEAVAACGRSARRRTQHSP